MGPRQAYKVLVEHKQRASLDKEFRASKEPVVVEAFLLLDRIIEISQKIERAGIANLVAVMKQCEPELVVTWDRLLALVIIQVNHPFFNKLAILISGYFNAFATCRPSGFEVIGMKAVGRHQAFLDKQRSAAANSTALAKLYSARSCEWFFFSRLVKVQLIHGYLACASDDSASASACDASGPGSAVARLSQYFLFIDFSWGDTHVKILEYETGQNLFRILQQQLALCRKIYLKDETEVAITDIKTVDGFCRFFMSLFPASLFRPEDGGSYSLCDRLLDGQSIPNRGLESSFAFFLSMHIVWARDGLFGCDDSRGVAEYQDRLKAGFKFSHDQVSRVDRVRSLAPSS